MAILDVFKMRFDVVVVYLISLFQMGFSVIGSVVLICHILTVSFLL